ncbi:MAG: DUF624 domain-containing protein [Acholeplasmataceae bacterium]|nr:DUF624 domain-containing protein [Acholeplasmataceae bacterium]MCK9233712.1 DUF624 domain-containing protein [Acholeplasmataceae bacterium]MCK9289548.1 DUF624 domain-containing protein [Acholeplasmataceae bacterium]MCK9427600.1 DUF624 domain-containing protein [Acholeplasmataceae bacterium]HHT39121.1 YesL family protein [Acholeplasmataceae bacterium]
MLKKQENKLIQILNNVADWVIRIFLVNFLTILASIPLITIIPALTSGYKIMSDALNRDEAPIFKSYFKTFKEEFKDKLIISVIIAIILGLSIYNNLLYADYLKAGKGVFYNIGYYLTLVLIIGVAMVAMYLPLVFVEMSTLELTKKVKLAFYLSGKYFLRTILISFSLLIPIAMFFSTPTIFIFIFVGVSIPLLIIAALTKKPRLFLKELKEND